MKTKQGNAFYSTRTISDTYPYFENIYVFWSSAEKISLSCKFRRYCKVVNKSKYSDHFLNEASKNKTKACLGLLDSYF